METDWLVLIFVGVLAVFSIIIAVCLVMITVNTKIISDQLFDMLGDDVDEYKFLDKISHSVFKIYMAEKILLKKETNLNLDTFCEEYSTRLRSRKKEDLNNGTDEEG